ncbi:MAG: hypothetical protein KDD25_04685, partial [Bdellovibrionales bacterium]|nr:hypothetical protein [Bdellovibrionales bacterium]
VETTYDFGKKVKAEKVMDALIEAASMTPYDQAQKGEKVAIEHTSRTPGNDPYITAYTDYYVTDRVEDDTAIVISFVKKSFDKDRVLQEEVGFDVGLDKVPLQSQSINPNKNAISFHKLKVFREMIEAPRNWASKPNCGGIPDCRVPVVTVQFNMVDNSDEENPVVFVYTISYATDEIPGYWSTNIINLELGLFPGYLKACIHAILEGNGNQDQPVEICETVVDMERK